MKEEIHDINEIIIRYLDGSAELEEKRLLLRWLKQSDDNRMILLQLVTCGCLVMSLPETSWRSILLWGN